MDASHYDHKKLQMLRERKFTQQELADRIGRNVKTISRAETGNHASFKLLSEMTSACGASIKEIIYDTVAAV